MNLPLLKMLTVVMLFSFTAFAQAVDPTTGEPLPAPWYQSILSGSSLASIATLALAAIGGLVWFTTRRKRLIAKGAHHIFGIVEDIGNEIEGNDGFDKAAAALKVADDWFKAHGWRPLTPGEQALLQLELKAIHGAELAKEKVAVAAAGAAAKAVQNASPPTPT
jgi:hypothetical protein